MNIVQSLILSEPCLELDLSANHCLLQVKVSLLRSALICGCKNHKSRFSPQGLWSVQTQIVGHDNRVRDGFHLVEWVLIPIREWLVLSVMSLWLQQVYTGRRVITVAYRVHSWVRLLDYFYPNPSVRVNCQNSQKCQKLCQLSK